MIRTPYEGAVTGDVLQRIRLEHGWSQAELARMAHCSISTISSVERGLRPLSATKFLTLCRSLDCLPSELLKEP